MPPSHDLQSPPEPTSRLQRAGVSRRWGRMSMKASRNGAIEFPINPIRTRFIHWSYDSHSPSHTSIGGEFRPVIWLTASKK